MIPEPPREGRGRPREYPPDLLFEAFLKILYHGIPLRSPLGKPYPSPAPLHRELMFWIETGSLRGIWRAYLASTTNSVKASWARALLDTKPAKQRMDNRHLGLRRHAYWYLVAVEELRAVLPRR